MSLPPLYANETFFESAIYIFIHVMHHLCYSILHILTSLVDIAVNWDGSDVIVCRLSIKVFTFRFHFAGFNFKPFRAVQFRQFQLDDLQFGVSY